MTAELPAADSTEFPFMLNATTLAKTLEPHGKW